MRTIGRFTVRGLLGKGGMGRVFKVAYPVTGKIAALKLLDPPPLLRRLTGREKLERLFTREAVAMAGIRHPHVVDILDFDCSGKGLYYIMDFYCNSLASLMGEAREEDPTRVISIEKAIRYVRQTLQGLVCLHYSGIIHRDIKPANLLITDLDTIRICDFGLSKLRGESLVHHGSIRVGSPFYAAPEQETEPDDVDATADIYAVGVVLFKMLTGLLPGQTDSPPSALNPDLDRDWDAFIFQALDPDPAGRFPSARDMLIRLEALERAWIAKKERICALPEEFEEPHPPLSPSGPARSKPEKIPLKHARERFGLTPLMQPVRYPANAFESLSPDMVRDRRTGLVWQRSGTSFPVNWHQAGDYVSRLNTERWGGYDQWRLPTIPELLTLVTPLARGRDLCLPPLFDPDQQWLWSSDRATFVSAWYVGLESGFVARNDFSSFYHVKAVCTPD